MNNNQVQYVSGNQETIVALCTPQGLGAIALIRLSGDNVLSIADKMSDLPSGKKLSAQKTHTIHFGYVKDDQGKHVDQVLFLLMKAPRTFTGQNTVEITCHNNQFLVDKIIDRAIACGARLAAGGEFTQRAVINGKIDLIQAEAIYDLIHAQTTESLKYSLQQLEGNLSSWVIQIEQLVIEMMAFCEASFEFLDEEMEFVSDIQKKMDMVMQKVAELLTNYSKQQYVKEGIRIALVGSTNAGKSSLFNCLLAKQRAIVSDIAGTTRDVIEAGVYKWGTFITFVDTAGIRSTEDAIEKQGIDRSFQEVQGADIILLINDYAAVMSDQEKEQYEQIVQQYKDKVVVVRNKVDLLDKASLEKEADHGAPVVLVSSKNPESVQGLYEVIHVKIKALQQSGNVSCLLNKRQHVLLSRFAQQLVQIKPMLYKKQVDYELLSHELKESLQVLCEMTGKSVSEATMNQVFDSFCVGK